MVIALAATGAPETAVAANFADIPYPTGITAGDLLVIFLANKYPPVVSSAPTGWVALVNNNSTGGAGASGVGTGQTNAAIYIKVADGTEAGTVQVPCVGLSLLVSRMYRFTKSSTKRWGVAMAMGADNTAGTSWNVTAASNMGIQTGDYLAVCFGSCEAVTGVSSTSLTATGLVSATLGNTNVRQTTSGDDMALGVVLFSAVSGIATSAPTFITTVTGGTGGTTSAGGVVFMRMREEPEATINTGSDVLANPRQMTSSEINTLSSVLSDLLPMVQVNVSTSSVLMTEPHSASDVEIVSTTNVDAIAQTILATAIELIGSVAAEPLKIGETIAAPLQIYVSLNLPTIAISLNNQTIQIEVE
jgi:hypothetical protein